MSSEVHSVPLILKYEEQVPVKVDSETMIALIMYYAEDHRKKPGFIRRRGERIKHVTIVYQPLIVLEIGNRQAVVVDPVSPPKLEIEFVEPLFNNVKVLFDELHRAFGKEFLDRLVRTRDHLKDIANKKRDVLKHKYTFIGVIHNRELLDELNSFLTIAPSERLPGYTISFREPDLESIKTRIEDLRSKISNAINEINELLITLDKIFGSWRQLLVREYERKLEEVKRELEETKSIVDTKVTELKERLNEELSSVDERYRVLIDNTMKNIESIDNELRSLYEELRKRQAYGGDVKEVKKRISSLEKRKKDLNKQQQQLRKKHEEEREAVRKRFDKLVEAELQRVRVIENELKRLMRERDSLIAHAREDVDEIRRLFLKINDYVMSVNKRVDNILIPLPPTGSGTYTLPFVVVVYERMEAERSILIPPLYYRVKKGLIRKTSLSEASKIKSYLSRYDKIYFDNRYRNDIVKHDIFPTISVERIEYALRRVAEEGLFSKSKIEPIVTALKEQLEIIKK